MSERPNALLTGSQREKLTTEDEGAYTRQLRKRVRERTQNGTKDLALLFEHLEDRDIKQIFEPDKKALKETVDVLEALKRQVRAYRRRAPLGKRGGVAEIEDLAAELVNIVRQQNRVEEKREELLEQNDTEGNGLSEEMVTRREDIDMRLDDLRSRREEILDELRQIIEDYTERLAETRDSMDEAERLVERIPTQELHRDQRDKVSELKSLIRQQRRQAESVLNIVNRIQETLDFLEEDEEDVEYLRSQIEEIEDFSESTRRDREEPQPHHIIRQLEQEVESELKKAELDPDIRDDVIDGLAFFLRVSDVVGTATDELVEEALLRMYEQEHTDEVVDHAVVSVETTDRDAAAERAARKPKDERLSNAELRALVEQDPRSLSSRYEDRTRVTEAGLIQRIRDSPDILEEGLEIVDAEPQTAGGDIVPDLVAKDSEGRIVLVEAKTKVTDIEAISKRLHHLIDSYGGADRVRGLLVIPERISEEYPDLSARFDDPIEVKPVAQHTE